MYDLQLIPYLKSSQGSPSQMGRSENIVIFQIPSADTQNIALVDDGLHGFFLAIVPILLAAYNNAFSISGSTVNLSAIMRL